MKSNDTKMGKILHSVGYISTSEYDECVEVREAQGGSLSGILLDRGYITEGMRETARAMLVSDELPVLETTGCF